MAKPDAFFCYLYTFSSSKLSFFSNPASVDIWHLFGLISRISGLLYGFFLCFRIQFLSSFSYRYFFFLVFLYRTRFRMTYSLL